MVETRKERVGHLRQEIERAPKEDLVRLSEQKTNNEF